MATTPRKPKQSEAADRRHLHVKISGDLYRRLRRRALDEDTTVTEVTLKALERYLASRRG